MQTRFLLGPAGSGKTFRCLAEARAALLANPEGPPLLFLAPKQATFQIERQLLADGSLPGYTRLQILSFDRLAHFLVDQLAGEPPRLLEDEGRVMVLRALLARHTGELKVFRAVSRLTGFAQHLSRLLLEFQQHQLSPAHLLALAEKVADTRLADKLHDLAFLLRGYLDWLQAHALEDSSRLLDLAAAALRLAGRAPSAPGITLEAFWLDGFAEMTPQELDLLAALVPHCARATLAFCLEGEVKEEPSWLSTWSVVSRTFRRSYQSLSGLPGREFFLEVLPRVAGQGRFAHNPALRHLEEFWTAPRPFDPSAAGPEKTAAAEALTQAKISRRAKSHDLNQLEFGLFPAAPTASADSLNAGPMASPAPAVAEDNPAAVKLVACANPEAETIMAAHEILRHVRAGGRYREVAVLLRTLDGHHDVLRRTLRRFDIPFFLDRREPIARHPLAELSRYALRVAAFHWRHDDWFGVLKTGLVPVDEAEADALENEALQRGWEGAAWAEALRLDDDPGLAQKLEPLRQRLVQPFQEFSRWLFSPENGPAQNGCSGRQIAEALRELWRWLDVDQTLERWEDAGPARGGAFGGAGATVHRTVREQMEEWLDNVELAFPTETMSLPEWLPVLEAGLAGLTVGVIPPALDQVLVGTIDRSRNPDLELVLVLGMNEAVFPAPPPPASLLNESDRAALANENVHLSLDQRQRLAQEHFYGYIACTRSRGRLVLGWSASDAAGKGINPSPFVAQVQRLFPQLAIEIFHPPADWRESTHAGEVAEFWGKLSGAEIEQLTAAIPALQPQRGALDRVRWFAPSDHLPAAVAEELYGPVLKSSVSKLEQFAECPFRFLVTAGLRAAERRFFELEVRERGSFQHELLSLFHEELRAENKRWRDLAPAEARERIGRIAARLEGDFGNGLLRANARNLFQTRSLTAAVQDFIETTLGWMPQYEFDPARTELGFGMGAEGLPAWELALANGHRLSLRGRIDRIDLVREPDGTAACVVMDYKSSTRRLDPVLLDHGLQLQLPAYLAVLRQPGDLGRHFGIERLIPAGVFYVNLRGRLGAVPTRNEALQNAAEARRRAYQHLGRFDEGFLRRLDNRAEVRKGDQFRIAIKRDGGLSKNGNDGLSGPDFQQVLNGVEAHLVRMGEAIYAGAAAVDPYQSGTKRACDYCLYSSICRIDPWTHEYRVLRPLREPELIEEGGGN